MRQLGLNRRRLARPRKNPSSDVAFTSAGAFNPAYWASTKGGHSQAVWNESWGPIGTGGGASVIDPRPSWQAGVRNRDFAPGGWYRERAV